MAPTRPISPLVAAIIEQSSRDLAFTTNSLIDSLTQQRDELEVELTLIREKVLALIGGDFMPTAHAIDGALHPSQGAIEYRLDLEARKAI
jgi:hypothetical protein